MPAQTLTQKHLLVLAAALPALLIIHAVWQLFWGGYLLHPQARAFGMVLTLTPTVLAYAWLASHLWHARGP